MKYKVGDKVKIKIKSTWDSVYVKAVNNLPDKAATIREIKDGYYYMNEIDWKWDDTEIECLVEEHIVPEDRINSRFDILDL